MAAGKGYQEKQQHSCSSRGVELTRHRVGSAEPRQRRRAAMAGKVPEAWQGCRREQDLMCRCPRMGKRKGK